MVKEGMDAPLYQSHMDEQQAQGQREGLEDEERTEERGGDRDKGFVGWL